MELTNSHIEEIKAAAERATVPPFSSVLRSSSSRVSFTSLIMFFIAPSCCALSTSGALAPECHLVFCGYMKFKRRQVAVNIPAEFFNMLVISSLFMWLLITPLLAVMKLSFTAWVYSASDITELSSISHL